ncbi:MAG: DUF1326 domain-containing protein [Actinobacteria bacterium]|nr:DUF1326 domain-containing protein [Actinomycetota bacterium]
MSWNLEGTYFENCNCDVLCPCAATGFAHPGDYERCHVVFAFHVDRGEVDGIDVADRNVVLVVDAPGNMGEGNWRVGVMLDARASEEQAQALGAVFGGQKGGPMAAVAPLIGEMLGVETATIDYSDDGIRHRVSVADRVDIEVEDFAGEDGEAVRLDGFAHPVNSTLALARATRSKVDAFGLRLANEAKNAHSARFAWSA